MLKVFSLPFTYVEIFRGCCGENVGLSWKQVVLVVTDCVLALLSRHLRLR